MKETLKGARTRFKAFLTWFDPKDKPLRRRILLSALTGLMLVTATSLLGYMNLYFGTGIHKLELLEFYEAQDERLVALNVIPFVMLGLLLWALTNRAWISFLGTGIFTLIYSWAEYWKLLGRSDPIIAEDLTIIKEGMQMGTNYIMVTWQIVLSAVLVLLGTLLFFFFFRGRLPAFPPRLALSLAVVMLSLGLYHANYTDAQLYKSFPCWKKLNRWIDSNQFISRGCIYPFLYSIQQAGVQPPDGYTPEEAVRTLEQYATDDIPEDRKVNVIVVMYEAYADLSACTDRITLRDPYASFHKLQAESLHGTLATNIFAAGTIDTERCVLTGFSSLTNFRRASWSYARYFGSQGYALNGSHPSYKGFYNRTTVNSNLGISNYYFMENHYKEIWTDGLAPDRILLPEIVRLCREDLKTSDYVFSFNVTYQNHGPYPSEEGKERFTDPYVPAEGIQKDSYIIVNNYLSGAEDTGNQMLAMTDLLRDDDTPYVLVFFGDHKPWLGNQNSVYKDLGIDLESSTEESFFNYFGTEYLIWANDAAKQKLGADFTGEGPVISPCYLMNVLFEECGWTGPSFLKLSEDLRARLPIVTTTGRFRENGELISEDQISAESQELLRKFKYVQFYLMRDSGGALPASN